MPNRYTIEVSDKPGNRDLYLLRTSDGATKYVATIAPAGDWQSASDHAAIAAEIVDALNGAHLYQELHSKNDPNGNPQRITMVYCARTGDVVAALDHEYRGAQIPRGATTLPTFEISRSEYRRTLKAHKKATEAFRASVSR